MSEDISFVLPSSPEDLKKIRRALEEAVNCEIRMDSERAAKKEIVAEIHEKYQLPKKMIGRMVSTMHKHNYSEVASEMDEFQIAYEKITQG